MLDARCSIRIELEDKAKKVTIIIIAVIVRQGARYLQETPLQS